MTDTQRCANCGRGSRVGTPMLHFPTCARTNNPVTPLRALLNKWRAEIAEYDDREPDHDPEDWMSGHRDCAAELEAVLEEMGL